MKNNHHRSSLEYFKLRDFETAKVSEISEAVAVSPIPPEERVNFHIGNPVQDERLIQLYFSLASGCDINLEEVEKAEIKSDISKYDWGQQNKQLLQLLGRAIRNSSPYMPRGGFSRQNPGRLIIQMQEWLQNQQDPLEYDFGRKSTLREAVICSGGIWESLRVLFHGLDRFLVNLPANVLLMNIDLPEHLKSFSSLNFISLPAKEDQASADLEIFLENNIRPNFLVMGSTVSEDTRRFFRKLSLEYPLFFIEANDALNHLSLAREAKMFNRVLRFISPAVFSAELSGLSTIFALGNSSFIKLIENVHFEIKGTPASADTEMLAFLINSVEESENSKTEQEVLRDFDSNEINFSKSASGYFEMPKNILKNSVRFTDRNTDKIENTINKFMYHGQEISQKLQQFSMFSASPEDTFFHFTPGLAAATLFKNIDSPDFIRELSSNLLSVFIKLHPQYTKKNLFLVSGSARTALSLLGFHAGIDDVITCDLSWTYEHCFPSVETVPLYKGLDIDIEALKYAVEHKLKLDQDWRFHGAVIINNPHNATGKVIGEEKLKPLLQWLLERDIFVIDDLSYQNVYPADSHHSIKTLREISAELARGGYIHSRHEHRIITVHSFSKTDSFAGARLAVVEILDPQLAKKFGHILSSISVNSMAVLLAYLFYRNRIEDVMSFWKLRNKIFFERMSAIKTAMDNLPDERNPFEIDITEPEGSMYPHMVINKLPAGISLDWLSSGLAKKGIGLVPLSTFARTAQGFEAARKTFRLTLGGTSGAEELQRKTRRVLIDLNRTMAEEAANYNRISFSAATGSKIKLSAKQHSDESWKKFFKDVQITCGQLVTSKARIFTKSKNNNELIDEFLNKYLSPRLAELERRFKDRLELCSIVCDCSNLEKRKKIFNQLEKELYKDNLETRSKLFKNRLFDRTVHPTQMFALKVDTLIDSALNNYLLHQKIDHDLIRQTASAVIEEFLGINVPISSIQEADELICDLDSYIWAENYTRWTSNAGIPVFLSFWGDWDGSTRPSGQGHRLVAAVVMENVLRMAAFLNTLMKYDKSIRLEDGLEAEIQYLPAKNEKYWKLLNKITYLTNQLEKRFKSVMPFEVTASRSRKIGMKLHLVSDPWTALWQHNDRLERKMLDLRNQRRQGLEYYFSLNKKLRKTLHSLLGRIERLLEYPEISVHAGLYHNLLDRFVLTPRIHQNLITSNDPFAIDTTVSNINEINEISGKYGNPGMVMALQVSMSSEPEALISLDRKIRSYKEQILRENPEADIPPIWIIPLFEEGSTVGRLQAYLDKVWEYAVQSRRLDQDIKARFAEIICEIFIAGSDLSQQISQPSGAFLYRKAKFETILWSAQKGLIEDIRMKLGSGEPMQRQGGYYAPISGMPAFLKTKDTQNRLAKNIKPSIKKSTEYARTPLLGVFCSTEFRTFQSTIAEQIRRISLQDRAELLYHIQETQKFYKNELLRAAEPLQETRLHFKEYGKQELGRIAQTDEDEMYAEFTELLTQNFRQILYGSPEDVVGIHVISYFISRTTPSLRDRPTIRPVSEPGESGRKKIIERLARTLPLEKHGSLLRAIGHNRAQTMILGINQLTTGLFRTLSAFAEKQFSFSDGLTMVSERILPGLPVMEILHSLRIYHDPDQIYVDKMEKAFHAGNSAFLYLREDNDCMNSWIHLLQKEYLRRHGMDIKGFFSEDGFIEDILPAIRPDIAVLMQRDLFNSDADKMVQTAKGKIDISWRNEVENLLEIPVKVRELRKKIWDLIEVPIFEQTAGFVELASAIHSLSAGLEFDEQHQQVKTAVLSKTGLNITQALRGVKDDSMRQFLSDALQYLTQMKTMAKAPVNIIRALKDIEKIVQIEAQALSAKEQDLFRFYMLQTARLCGENG